MRKGQRNRKVVTPTKPSNSAFGKVLFVTDIHFPYQDDNSVERFLDHASSEEVGTIIVGGDAIDAYSVSKYDPDPKRLLQLQSELDLLDEFLAKLAALQPHARKLYLLGNHEARIPLYLRRNAPALESLRSLSMGEILGTNKNGYELVGREGLLIDGSRYKHGDAVAKGAGNSVIKEMEKHWRSVFMGHCHRRATRRIRKDDREFVGAEAGGLMGLNPDYVQFPDWQPGWLLNTHSGDGHVDVRECTP